MNLKSETTVTDEGRIRVTITAPSQDGSTTPIPAWTRVKESLGLTYPEHKQPENIHLTTENTICYHSDADSSLMVSSCVEVTLEFDGENALQDAINELENATEIYAKNGDEKAKKVMDFATALPSPRSIE